MMRWFISRSQPLLHACGLFRRNSFAPRVRRRRGQKHQAFAGTLGFEQCERRLALDAADGSDGGFLDVVAHEYGGSGVGIVLDAGTGVPSGMTPVTHSNSLVITHPSSITWDELPRWNLGGSDISALPGELIDSADYTSYYGSTGHSNTHSTVRTTSTASPDGLTSDSLSAGWWDDFPGLTGSAVTVSTFGETLSPSESAADSQILLILAVRDSNLTSSSGATPTSIGQAAHDSGPTSPNNPDRNDSSSSSDESSAGDAGEQNQHDFGPQNQQNKNKDLANIKTDAAPDSNKQRIDGVDDSQLDQKRLSSPLIRPAHREKFALRGPSFEVAVLSPDQISDGGFLSLPEVVAQTQSIEQSHFAAIAFNTPQQNPLFEDADSRLSVNPVPDVARASVFEVAAVGSVFAAPEKLMRSPAETAEDPSAAAKAPAAEELGLQTPTRTRKQDHHYVSTAMEAALTAVFAAGIFWADESLRSASSISNQQRDARSAQKRRPW